MGYWMFGIDNEKAEETAKLYRQHGINTVLLGNNPAAIEACLQQGLKVYLSCGAFGIDTKNPPKGALAKDIYGDEQIWFSSGCPNNLDIRKNNLESVLKLCQVSGIEGIIMDGARFSSPFSSTDIRSFFTCFCDTCKKKAADLGFDFDSMKQGVFALYEFSIGKRTSFAEFMGDIMAWFAFRRICATEHLRDFSKTVKLENSKLKTGAFLFSPSIAWLVGQSYGDLKGNIDVFVPMIYRAYKQDFGPACLNHELARTAELLSGSGVVSEELIISQIANFTGIDLSGYHSNQELLKGLPVEAVYSETQKVMQIVGDFAQVVPILDFDDDELNASIACAKRAGVQDVALFAYKKELFDKKKEVLANGSYSEIE